MQNKKKSVLVVSAHSADFVWRAGGAIALYAKRDYQVRIVCLSFGERGESAKLWKDKTISMDEVKRIRREEAESAASTLGAEVVFYDIGDYPLYPKEEHLFNLVDEYRSYRPEFVLTHSLHDPYNFDHSRAAEFAQEARITAQAHGHNPEQGAIGAPPVFQFEPHQPEQCDWKPRVFLNIDEVWDIKRKAFKAMDAQQHLWDYYTRVALQRGVQAKRNSGKNITYAEAYQRIFPFVTDELI